MALKSTGFKLGMASANPIELSNAVDRLKEEHAILRKKIKHLELSAKEVNLLEDLEKGHQILKKLMEETDIFVNELEQHADWEEHELFAFLHAYFQREPVPSILPSFWVLEKDHELANSFIASFHDSVNQISNDTVGKERYVEAASHLLQACLILNDHLTMEEQLVYSLTEQVLTDLEYFFS